MSAQHSDATEHTLSREFKERREYLLAVIDGELEIQFSNSQYHCGEPLQTIKCTCGERFRKEQLAIEHIQSVASKGEQ